MLIGIKNKLLNQLQPRVYFSYIYKKHLSKYLKYVFTDFYILDCSWLLLAKVSIIMFTSFHIIPILFGFKKLNV